MIAPSCQESQDWSLQAQLKRAAAERLGTSLEPHLKEEELEASKRSAGKFEAALLEAKRKLAVRKAEVGQEAALSELESEFRKKSSATERSAAQEDGGGESDNAYS